jgi:glycosyltransferase involved in cell wall biosynthesis
MRVLMVNNYMYKRGGSEAYMFALSDLLRSRGNEVLYFGMGSALNLPTAQDRYFVPNIVMRNSNRIIGLRGAISRLQRVIYYRHAKRSIARLIQDVRPDIVHLHNIAHYLSPSVLVAVKDAGLPAVQTLHDFKIACPAWLFLSKGRLCERCKGHRYYHALRRRCLKDSFAASAVVALEAYVHNALGLYLKYVDRFIVPSRFQLRKMVEHGIPEEKLTQIPHFSGIGEDTGSAVSGLGGYVLYAGRLSQEKGLRVLLDAMRIAPELRLEIAGEGPLRDEIERVLETSGISNVKCLGHLEGAALRDAYLNAACVVVPSLCYETWGLSIQEAYAFRKPVVASRLGALEELVHDGLTGLLVKPGDEEDLAGQLRRLIQDAARAQHMGEAGYRMAMERWSVDSHYAQVMAVYQSVSASL